VKRGQRLVHMRADGDWDIPSSAAAVAMSRSRKTRSVINSGCRAGRVITAVTSALACWAEDVRAVQAGGAGRASSSPSRTRRVASARMLCVFTTPGDKSSSSATV
jgi:hypothetical protein